MVGATTESYGAVIDNIFKKEKRKTAQFIKPKAKQELKKI
jgi:hypothetical protein